MASVAIQKRPGASESDVSLLEENQNVFDRLRKRAYALFQRRGGAFGSDLDDWFAAERELLNLPQSDLTEDEKGFRLKASVPGLKAKDLEVTVTPRELLVRGRSETEEKREEGEALISERCHNEVFRRYTLPSPIDVDKASAKVDEGLLTVDLPKAPQRKLAVAEKGKAA